MQTLKSRRAAVLALLALASAVVTPAWSQTYPTRPVKLVTQGAAGSGSDVVARLVADQLARMWDQQIVVLNHPGAGGSSRGPRSRCRRSRRLHALRGGDLELHRDARDVPQPAVQH
jgi:hypothetical protein